MGDRRLELIEEQLDEQQDDEIAMRYAFIALVRTLEEAGSLRLDALADHLRRTSQALREGSEPGNGDLSPAAERIDSLRETLLQLG